MRITPKARNVLGFLLLGCSANATVLINQPGPYPQHLMGDGSTCLQDYAGDTASAGGVNVSSSSGQGYRVLNTSDGNTLIWMDVSSNVTFNPGAGQNAAVSITPTGATVPITLTGAGTIGNGAPNDASQPPACNTGVGYITCQTGVISGQTITNAYANYTSGSVLRVSFTLAAFCAATGASGTLCSTTSGYLQLINNYLTQPFTVNFNIITATSPSAAVVAGSSSDQGSCTLGVTDIQPAITCPTAGSPIQDYYFPGDQQVYLNTGNYPTSNGTNASGMAGSPVQSLVLVAQVGSTAPSVIATGIPSGALAGYVGASGGTQSVTGFTNATSANDTAHTYAGMVYAMNDAGIFSDTNPDCAIYPLQSQPVSGLLTESKCFIATAAFHDGHAAPVMMLRHFRDEVLAKSDLGQRFIETYYTYSPALAEWAWDKPIIRSFALKLLAPVELMAWAILKITHAEEASPQPYIDRMKKEIEIEDAKNGKTPNESYIDSVKKKLVPNPPPSESYTEQQKKLLSPKDSPDGFTEKEKQNLPPEEKRDSPIEMVKEKRDHYPVPTKPPITGAFGFKLGVSPNVQVNNSKNTNQGATFGNIYGSGWQPDLVFHGEKQLFHSETFGSFALGGDLGISYAEGYGQLSFPFGDPATTNAQTKFSFLQVPVMADAYYRFNLFRAIRPYAGIGVGAVFFDEIRHDQLPDKYGHSFVYDACVGGAFLLDFIDTKTKDDSYLGMGIQHAYLTVEYNYLSSFQQTGVSFKRNGIYAGFLFEY